MISIQSNKKVENWTKSIRYLWIMTIKVTEEISSHHDVWRKNYFIMWKRLHMKSWSCILSRLLLWFWVHFRFDFVCLSDRLNFLTPFTAWHMLRQFWNSIFYCFYFLLFFWEGQNNCTLLLCEAETFFSYQLRLPLEVVICKFS
jgi:hypothetical protein